MAHKGEVYFALYGSGFDPDEVTRLIGLTPTSIKRERIPRPKDSVWIFSMGKIEGELLDIIKLSSDLVSQLNPHLAKIVEAKNVFDLTPVLQVNVSFSNDESISTPAIGFETDVISFLNTVGANIDIDTYLQ